MRSCLRRRRSRSQNLSCHDGYEQDGADVMQPRSRRNCKGTDSARGGRARRKDGYRHRQDGDSVQNAQPLERTRHVVAKSTMRQGKIHLGVETPARHHTRTRHLAGPGDGNHTRTQRQLHSSEDQHTAVAHRRREDIVGSGDIRSSSNCHSRHLPQRTDAHRKDNGAGRTHCRTGGHGTDRIYRRTRNTTRTHEDGNARQNRRTLRRFQPDGEAGRRRHRPDVRIPLTRGRGQTV